MMDLVQLRSLVEVAERGTVAAAATAQGYTAPAVSQHLAKLEAEMQSQASDGRNALIEGDIAVRHVHALQQRLPGLTEGEGVLETVFGHYRPVKGAAPIRARTDANPLNRKEYLETLARRG